MEEQNQNYYSELISPDYGYAFDDPAFSDRILKLLIVDDSQRDNVEFCKLKDLFSVLKQKKEEIFESQQESRVKSLHVNSLILAAKSPFFDKLFTNGMKASTQHEVTIRIHSSEEAAFIGVIKFMYDGKLLSADAPPNALLEMLLTADKFCVSSCVEYCCKLLLSFPMTAEMALCYLDLPSIMSVNEIQPLLTAAQEFLPIVLKNIRKYRKHIMKLSLEGIRIILSRDDLKVDIEDAAYDLLVDWAKEQYPDDSKEQQRVLTAEMFDLIRFQHMTPPKLKTVLREFFDSNHLDPDAITSMTDAIVLDENKSSFRMHSRAYCLHPIAVVTFKDPVKHCMVYLDLKREECKDIKYLRSQSFTFDDNTYYLLVEREKNEMEEYTFGIYLFLKARKTQSDLTLQFEFASRQNRMPYEFVRRKTITHTFKSGKTNGYGNPNLFGPKWDAVMKENSQFLVNGTLHLRTNITLLTGKVP